MNKKLRPEKRRWMSSQAARAFATRDHMKRFKDELDALIFKYETFRQDPATQDIDWQRIDDAMQVIRSEMLDNLPYEACSCVQVFCPRCEGRRWISYKRKLDLLRASEVGSPIPPISRMAAV